MTIEESRIDKFSKLFEVWDALDREQLYRVMLFSLRANSGLSFDHNDQGGTLYRVSARGEDFKRLAYNDSPETNDIYHMMRALSGWIYDRQPILQLRTKNLLVNSWQDFCRIAVEGSDRMNGVRPVKNEYEDGET